jgi:hypothetical protein
MRQGSILRNMLNAKEALKTIEWTAYDRPGRAGPGS